jgi:hypothetical protein
MPWLLYPHGNCSWYPLDKRLGRPQSLSGHSGEEKNSQPLLGLKPLILQPIAQHYATELYQLLYTYSIYMTKLSVLGKIRHNFVGNDENDFPKF